MCVLAHVYQPSGRMCWLMFRVIQNTDNHPQNFVASQPRSLQTVHVLQLKFPSKHVSQRCSAFSVNWNRMANLRMCTGNHYPVHIYTVVETTAIKNGSRWMWAVSFILHPLKLPEVRSWSQRDKPLPVPATEPSQPITLLTDLPQVTKHPLQLWRSLGKCISYIGKFKSQWKTCQIFVLYHKDLRKQNKF